jgi:hypothetical protein
METYQNIDIQLRRRWTMIWDEYGMRFGETHVFRSPFGELVPASRLYSEFYIGRLYHTRSTGMVSISLGVCQEIRRVAYVSRCNTTSTTISHVLEDRPCSSGRQTHGV